MNEKKYNLRTIAEIGLSIEIILELQELFNIYANGVRNTESELLLLQDSRSCEDFYSIDILLETNIKYDELSKFLKEKIDSEFHDEVDELIEVIKEAKEDNHTILHVYDC